MERSPDLTLATGVAPEAQRDEGGGANTDYPESAKSKADCQEDGSWDAAARPGLAIEERERKERDRQEESSATSREAG